MGVGRGRLHPGRTNADGVRGRAIPAGWAEAHRPWAGGTRNGTCTLTDPTTPVASVWDEDTEQWTDAPRVHYWDGTCRVKALNDGDASTVVTAEDDETVADYLVTIDATITTTSVGEGHLLTVTTSGDGLLDGRTLLIRRVNRGTERVEYDLYCTLTD